MNAQKYLHTAPPYVAADPEAIVRRHPFAVLITSGPAGILASSLPMFFEREDSTATMVGHATRLNTLMVNLKGGKNALAVFSGPHAYVSSGWYRERPSVPTWNYIAAQMRGTLEPIDDEADQLAVLERTVSLVEQKNEPA